MCIPGVDYSESFAPVITDTRTRWMITLYLFKSNERWVIEMIDYEVAYLNGDARNEVFIKYPKEMVELGFLT